ncbi:MAG: hypothetical protein ABSF95_02515 [Verrucomicrobiota bacterium]|jgi:hypothetical protein
MTVAKITRHRGLFLKGLGVALSLLVLFGACRLLRARASLVTLRVREAEVREVVRQIERQTSEAILVHRDVQGRVTLEVKEVPLPQVLMLVAQQVRSRSLVLYPLYSSPKALRNFKAAARGELEPTACGWSNLVVVFNPPNLPMLLAQARWVEEPITLRLTNRELRLATVAFSRFADIQVVPEDGTLSRVTLSLQAAPLRRAVQSLARQVRRRTAACWSLLPGLGGAPDEGRPPPDLAQMRGPPGGQPPPPGLLPPPPGSPPLPPPPQPPSAQTLQQMEQDFQDLMAVLPPAQRALLDAERQFQTAMQAMSPEQRQQALKQQSESQSGSLLESRRQGLRDSTVADRINRDRQETAGGRP